MKYRELSKFEINRLVAQKLGMNTDKADLPAMALAHDYNERYPNTVWAQQAGKPWEQFCFSSEPEQWGALVRDYSISLRFDTCQVHAKSYFADCSEASASHPDIGLAVCIAFLEMKDWKASNNV